MSARSLTPRTTAEASDALGAIVAAELREDGWIVEDSLHPKYPRVVGPLRWRESVRVPDGRLVPIGLRPRAELPLGAASRVRAIARRHGLCADADGWGGRREVVTVVDECWCGSCVHRAGCTCLECAPEEGAGR